ncbi:MAG: LPS export ABC transporter periplasmic protein LptC [Gemmatimonadales bacterium]|nr:MAG: LPS export ABC transporter periplasmic protein LptC [Gemmatimonadales bacterium]
MIRSDWNVRRWVLLATLCALPLAVGCEEEAPLATVPPEYLEFEADGIAFGMVHRFTQDGVIQAKVIADTTIQWNDSTSVALRVLEMDVYNEDGSERAHVVADRGWLDTRTNRMAAYGNVVLTVPGQGRRLESQELHYDPRAEEMWSDSSFVMYQQGEPPFRGAAFTTDLEFRDFRARGTGR